MLCRQLAALQSLRCEAFSNVKERSSFACAHLLLEPRQQPHASASAWSAEGAMCVSNQAATPMPSLCSNKPAAGSIPVSVSRLSSSSTQISTHECQSCV